MKTPLGLELTPLHAVLKAAKTYMRAVGARLAPLGLQYGQDMFLRQLWHEDDLAQSEIIERLGVEPPTVAKALSRLERDGFLTRRRDRADARVSRVSLTARGKKLRAPVEKIWREVEAAATDGMSEADKEKLKSLSLGVMARLKAQL